MRAKSAAKPQPKKASTSKKPPAGLNKSAPFVPKIINLGGAPIGNQNALGNEGGRPTSYEGEITCAVAKALVKAGCSDGMIARTMGIAPSTFYLWKAQHVEFSESLERGEEEINNALKATAIQRALGFSYETQKAFQTGVVVDVVETLPPSEKMLSFLLERRMPEEFRPVKEVHTHDTTMSGVVKAMNDLVALRREEQRRLAGLAPMLKAETIVDAR